jgi:hypothetical protein
VSTYSDMLDSLVTEVSAALGVPSTRDPSEVAGLVSAGGCIFVQFPVHVGRLLSGPNLNVPISLVAPAPADLSSVDWLLDHFDAFVGFFGTRAVVNGPVDIGSLTFPAVTVTAQIALDTTEVAP